MAAQREAVLTRTGLGGGQSNGFGGRGDGSGGFGGRSGNFGGGGGSGGSGTGRVVGVNRYPVLEGQWRLVEQRPNRDFVLQEDGGLARREGRSPAPDRALLRLGVTILEHPLSRVLLDPEAARASDLLRLGDLFADLRISGRQNDGLHVAVCQPVVNAAGRCFTVIEGVLRGERVLARLPNMDASILDAPEAIVRRA